MIFGNVLDKTKIYGYNKINVHIRTNKISQENA